MTIVKCADHIAVYRHKAMSSDLHELSGRTGAPWVTAFVARRIMDGLSLGPDSMVVDVGCGDGTLLRMVAESGARALGVLPTEEEVRRVREALSDLVPQVEIRVGRAEQTDLREGLATHVVCNGVLLLLAPEVVPAALRELARIARPDARVFIGELPAVDEFADRTYGESISGWLWWVLRRQGVSEFLRRVRQVFVALFTKEPLVVAPKRYFHMQPERFIEMARAAGLQLLSCCVHESVNARGEVAPIATRYDYWFAAAPQENRAA